MSKRFKLPINSITSSKTSPFFHDLKKWHQDSKGIWCPKFDRLAAHTTLCGLDCTPEKSASIIYTGSASSARDAWGDTWADTAHETGKTPFDDLEILAAPGYCDAFVNGINYDLIEYDNPHDAIIYERITWLIRHPENNAPFMLGCASITHYQG